MEATQAPPPDIRTRPGERAYGRVARALHWLVVVALAVQFAVGYALDAGGQGRGRGRGRGGESGRGRGRGGEDLDVFGDGLLTLHVVLGVTILALALFRLWWRRRQGLPPWAASLSSTERTVVHWVERALYTMLIVIPATGLWLVLVSDDAVALHVAAHVAFFVALAVHLGIVVKHQVLRRDGLLWRML